MRTTTPDKQARFAGQKPCGLIGGRDKTRLTRISITRADCHRVQICTSIENEIIIKFNFVQLLKTGLRGKFLNKKLPRKLLGDYKERENLNDYYVFFRDYCAKWF